MQQHFPNNYPSNYHSQQSFNQQQAQQPQQNQFQNNNQNNQQQQQLQNKSNLNSFKYLPSSIPAGGPQRGRDEKINSGDNNEIKNPYVRSISSNGQVDKKDVKTAPDNQAFKRGNSSLKGINFEDNPSLNFYNKTKELMQTQTNQPSSNLV
jgi:hypothetical protein